MPVLQNIPRESRRKKLYVKQCKCNCTKEIFSCMSVFVQAKGSLRPQVL